PLSSPRRAPPSPPPRPWQLLGRLPLVAESARRSTSSSFTMLLRIFNLGNISPVPLSELVANWEFTVILEVYGDLPSCPARVTRGPQA
ncbi:hypothetical protein VIGAN_01090700, partial [Vigna angularis var. angularis]